MWRSGSCFPGIIMAIQGKGDMLAKIGSILAIIAIVLFLVQAARATVGRPLSVIRR
jgi:hypothetical protein